MHAASAFSGIVPLFVSHDSAEVWTHRELFEVDPTGQCAAVVGVPPDAFAETGQFWAIRRIGGR